MAAEPRTGPLDWVVPGAEPHAESRGNNRSRVVVILDADLDFMVASKGEVTRDDEVGLRRTGGCRHRAGKARLVIDDEEREDEAT